MELRLDQIAYMIIAAHLIHSKIDSIFTLTSASWKRITTIWEQKKTTLATGILFVIHRPGILYDMNYSFQHTTYIILTWGVVRGVLCPFPVGIHIAVGLTDVIYWRRNFLITNTNITTIAVRLQGYAMLFMISNNNNNVRWQLARKNMTTKWRTPSCNVVTTKEVLK